MKRIWGDNDVGKLLRHIKLLSGRGRRGRGRGRRARSGFAPENFKHHNAAGRTFALDRFPSVLHGFFHGACDFLLGFTFDAVSFGHKWFLPKTHHAPGSYGTSLRVACEGRQQGTNIRRGRIGSACKSNVSNELRCQTPSLNVKAETAWIPRL